MLAFTYLKTGDFRLIEKPKPVIQAPRDAIVRVTLASVCTSDLHIKHGSVPRAVPGITVGHEMIGVVEETGSAITDLKKGDRVAVNVETFCGSCYFCRRGFVNNCTDKNGGWALGCRIDGGQAEFVRVPYADCGLTKIPDSVSDEQALFTGDILATGYWAAKIAEISRGDTVLIIGAGPTGICALQCALLHGPGILTVSPEEAESFVRTHSLHGGADCVIECGGTPDTFRLAHTCARPNAIVVIVALYDEPQILPLPSMYGKNLTFKTGGVDGCDCSEILSLIEQGKLNTVPLITHTFPLPEIEKAYDIFENKKENVIKTAIRCSNF